MQRKVLCLALLGSIVFHSAAAADPARDTARPQGHAGSTGKRVVWTLIGAGLGFGAGLLFGLRQYDDAINSDRKVWTSALVGAGAGGVAGALLSGGGSSAPTVRQVQLEQFPRDILDPARPSQVRGFVDQALLARVRAYNAETLQSPTPSRVRWPAFQEGATATRAPARDSLRSGMIAGALAGAVVGLIIVPNQECKSSNPECPRMLRIGVGIPAIAGGAAIGALVDKLFDE